jgi:hypothetical protein
MTNIDKVFDLSLRSMAESSTQSSAQQAAGSRKGLRPAIKEDFVIPHVGPTISDDQVLDFAEAIASSILDSPGRAVSAQANQNEEVKKKLLAD